jgi:hypothetical protein
MLRSFRSLKLGFDVKRLPLRAKTHRESAQMRKHLISTTMKLDAGLFASAERKIYLLSVFLELTGAPYARSVKFNVG